MVTFVESPLFTKQVHDYLSDDEYGGFQAFLAANPAHISKPSRRRWNMPLDEEELLAA